jgi:hypothetical protein
MFHVFEHVRCIATLADILGALVAPAGLLVLKTPNADSVVSRILRGWWEWSAVPEHVHLFTPSSLRAVLGSAGFVPDVMVTRRGDAHGTLHELIRGSARRLARIRPLGERLFDTTPADATIPAIGGRGRYAMIGRVLDGTSWPLDWLLDMSSKATGAFPQPELLVVARRSRPAASSSRAGHLQEGVSARESEV